MSTGTFSIPFVDEVDRSGGTGGNGVAVIYTTGEVKKPSYTFCVDSVVDGLEYISEDNIETCKSN